MGFRRNRSRRREKQELEELRETINSYIGLLRDAQKINLELSERLQDQINTVETELGGRIGTLRKDVDDLKKRPEPTP